MTVVGVDIHTRCSTQGRGRGWTGDLTSAADAGFTGLTDIVTGTTMGLVGLEVDTLTIAIGESGLTGHLAHPAGTELAGSTGFSTGSTVGAIGLEVYTVAVAVGES